MLALIASAAPSHDLVLDAGGVAGGEVFTDYASLVAAVAALDGFVRVTVLSDVTVSTGSFGDVMGRVDLIGNIALGAQPILLFDGDATHSAIPRTIDLMHIEVAATATVPPFVLSGASLLHIMTSALSIYTTNGGGQPIFRVNDLRVLIMVVSSVEMNPNGSMAIIDLAAADAQVQLQLTAPSLGNLNSIPDDSIAAVAATDVDILVVSEPDTQVNHPRDMAGVDPGATVSWTTFGAMGNVINEADVLGNRTFRRPNISLRLSIAVPLTITFDFSDTNIERGHYFELSSTPSSAEDIVTLLLVGGHTFLGGGTSRTIQQGGGAWRMVFGTNGEWALVGADGIENSPEGPLHVRPELATTDATPTAVHTRVVASNDQVLGIEAIVSGYDSTNNEQYKYQLTGQAKNIGGVLTLVATTDVIVEDDAAADAALVVSGTNVVTQITGVNAKNIDWKTKIDYMQVRP